MGGIQICDVHVEIHQKSIDKRRHTKSSGERLKMHVKVACLICCERLTVLHFPKHATKQKYTDSQSLS